MTSGTRFGILGGTFDPVHLGHVDTALAAQRALGLDRVLVLPSGTPPHRHQQPLASRFHRFAMAALAVTGVPSLELSDLEIGETAPSYTFDTLTRLHRAGHQPSEIFFITGADAFAEIATWHEFPAVLDGAHFAIIARPGMTIEAALARTPGLRSRARPAAAAREAAGQTGIFLVEAATRDVSSTLIRGRLAARQPIDDLVPSAVARHILAHHLYTEDDLHGHDEDN